MNRMLLCLLTLFVFGTATAGAAAFNHEQHLELLEGSACSTCHVDGADAITPDRSTCLSCHDETFYQAVEFPGNATHDLLWPLTHGPAAKADRYDCASCHQQEYCTGCHIAGKADEMGRLGNALTNVHLSDFSVTHPISARAANGTQCTSCHETSFCTDCHNNFNTADLSLLSHRKGFTLGTLDGAHAGFTTVECANCHVNSEGLTVLPGHEWSSQHAREARKHLASCQACHPEGETCLRCHSAREGLIINPHPKDWDKIADNLNKASGGRSCRKCH